MTELPAPRAALTRYLAFILAPAHANFVPVDAVTEIAESLGIERRLVYWVRLVVPEGPLLTVTTLDPSHVLAIHGKSWHPAEGRTLEERRQVGADTWEYEAVSITESVPHGEIALRLSRGPRRVRNPLSPIIPTVVHHVGWGRAIDNVEVDAAVDTAAFAWAVAELLTGLRAPLGEIHNRYERFRAAQALADYFGQELQT